MWSAHELPVFSKCDLVTLLQVKQGIWQKVDASLGNDLPEAHPGCLGKGLASHRSGRESASHMAELLRL